MFCVFGDIHGSQLMWKQCLTRILYEGDTIAIVGDSGIGFYGKEEESEEAFFDWLAEQPFTVLFCDGNHENFDLLNSYPISEWHGGRVHRIRDNILHLMRGEVFEIEGKRLFAMGGGASMDRLRRMRDHIWWKEELPSDAEICNAFINLKKHGNQADIILTHTAPIYTVEYMLHLGKGIKDTRLREYQIGSFLQALAETIPYQKWYFGHFHIDAELWKNQYAVYHQLRNLFTGEPIDLRGRFKCE